MSCQRQIEARSFGSRAIVACCAAFIASAALSQQGALETRLPASYAGEFQWFGDPVRQRVEIKIVTTERRDANHLEAFGCGRYDTEGNVTNIRVRMLIEEPSLAVEIWESEPVGTTFFITDGSHKGKLSDDLQSIEAVWSSPTGQTGRLRLHSGPSFICDPQVASLR